MLFKQKGHTKKTLTALEYITFQTLIRINKRLIYTVKTIQCN